MKTIYDYTDYRLFLKDLFEKNKSKDKKISLLYLGNKLNLSKTALKYVLDGVRHIATEKIEEYIQVFELQEEEANFFRVLVQFNKAKDIATKNKYYEKILALKNLLIKESILLNEQIGIFTDWHYPTISEMRVVNEFKFDAEWIQKKLQFPVSLESIRTAMQYLDKNGLIERNSQKTKIKTKKNLVSHVYKNYVFRQLELAKQALATQSYEEREFFTLTIALDQSRYDILKQRIEKFRHELHDLLADGESADRVVQINMQAFLTAKT